MVGAVGVVGVVVGIVVTVVGAVGGNVVGGVVGGAELVGAVLPTGGTVLTVGPNVVTVLDVPGACVDADVGGNSIGKQAATVVASKTIAKINVHFFMQPPPSNQIFFIIASIPDKSNRTVSDLQKIKGMPKGIPQIFGF